MSISNNRFRIYELLFSKPLYLYAQNNNGKLTNNVLILGSGEVGTEAFKAVYWCGQYSLDNQLNITIASANIDVLQRQIATEMPAVSVMNDMANISFIASLDLLTDDAFDPILFNKYSYDYVIIALGDNDVNKIVANRVKDSLLSACSNHKALVAVFDESGDAPFSEERFSFDSCDIVVCTFGNGEALQEDYQRKRSELERLAFNIDFSYAMEQDQRCSKAKIRERFNSDPYYSESSYACAVHIPYKLALCEKFVPSYKEKKIRLLSDAIAAENEIYSELVAVEHNRWVAYMAVNGYSLPTEEQLEAYAYTDGNDHRNKKLKLHPCMCPCDNTGHHLDEHYDLWDVDDETMWNGLAALDKTSLKLHQIARKKAKRVCDSVGDYFTFISELRGISNIKVFENLRLSAFKLCNDEENSIRLFNNALSEAKEESKDLADMVKSALERIERDFAVVIHRNSRTDFFANDATLVDRIPFCLWYGEKHKTIITFTKGVITEDVIVPTLLSAENAVFIGRLANEELYRDAAVRYFSGRGTNTNVFVELLPVTGVAEISTYLTNAISRFNNPVINCVDCDDPEILIAIGTVAEKIGVPVIQYDAKKGVACIINPAPFGSRLGNKSMSINEFTSLMGGEYKNVYRNVNSIDDYENFSRVFWKYSKEKKYWTQTKDGESKATVYVTWSALTNFFQSSTKDETPSFLPEQQIPPATYIGRFNHTVFRQCDIGHFLDELNQFHIISDLQTRQIDNEHLVEFVYVDSKIAELLHPFEEIAGYKDLSRLDCLYKKLKFNPANGITVSNTKAVDIPLLDSSENEKIKYDKKGFVLDLEKYGMIHSVRFSQDRQKISFIFKDEKIQQLFKTQGKIFELIIYHEIKNSGLFDDVQTSVMISWETDVKGFDQLFRDRMAEAGGLGYAFFKSEQKKLKDESFDGTALASTDNEIDVVMMLGMKPIFISCKTGKKGWNDWLNEISSLSTHFHAQPVLAVLKNLDLPTSNSFVSRAKKIGVSLIGIETISDSARFSEAIKQIAEGRTVYGPDTRRV